ncbi:MAG: hypothetical protein JWN29_2486 [Acidimicrobiales bacterium]|nr:hypothetical protein [Acidimicrobiales bacterium]
MLLYGDSPPSGEPTLELLRRPVPTDAEGPDTACALLAKALERWGWNGTVEAANSCLTAVVGAAVDAGSDSIELFAFRRAHRLNVEVHFSGAEHRFHQLLGREPRLAVIDALAPLWGVRSLNDGEAVWFEFRTV